jgi:hypothetical protein
LKVDLQEGRLLATLQQQEEFDCGSANAKGEAGEMRDCQQEQ